MPTEDAKHRAKRFNEGVKLLATLFNSLSIATFGAAFVVPFAQRHLDVFRDGGWVLLSAATSRHLVGQITLRFVRSED
ncbi:MULTISPECIES: hypothetical protein [unclassified Methylobacterium]|uniref:hypothetical protein n=1 Tax=unclassified Methylobacterium TaxID=2615210 RepID=UPI0006F8E21F|nr:MULTISPECIES: hypothetical protein [unclassified Methylobacterium]KQP52677.1 hypothetical protein ASF39_07155 [Methylobacterium sp. Leaf108]KQT84388.1 hypothetical protein ASG59_03130 [Methylobacterium sp. Leaf466]